jgi:DNA invertase Pin-like site-specific DNA recombinase
MKKIVGYIRCSCDKSDVENQRFEITNFCERNGLTIDEWVEETISGTKDYSTRKLGELLLRVDKNTRIICSEISRIGRNMYGVMDFLNHCMQRGCELWTIKDNFRLGDDLSSKVIAFAFALSAEI